MDSGKLSVRGYWFWLIGVIRQVFCFFHRLPRGSGNLTTFASTNSAKEDVWYKTRPPSLTQTGGSRSNLRRRMVATLRPKR